MKNIFFVLVALSIPTLLLIGVVYMFFQGLLTVYRDWQLKRELEELRQEAERRRRDNPEAKTAEFTEEMY